MAIAQNHAVTVSAHGQLDANAARRLKRDVAHARSDGAGTVVVDLGGVTHIDVLGLGAILALASGGVRVEIVPPRGTAGETLLLLGSSGRLSFRELPVGAVSPT